jgi:hypothetical protein
VENLQKVDDINGFGTDFTYRYSLIGAKKELNSLSSLRRQTPRFLSVISGYLQKSNFSGDTKNTFLANWNYFNTFERLHFVDNDVLEPFRPFGRQVLAFKSVKTSILAKHFVALY